MKFGIGLRFAFLGCILVTASNCLRFYLKVNERRCLREEIHKNILVSGEYELSEALGHRTHIKVVDSKDHILYQKEDASKGKISFTTEDYDMFEVCFETRVSPGVQAVESREVYLDLKHGIEAKDYQKLGEAQNLKPLELELRRLEDLSKSIVEDFAYMRAREEEMRDTNESTHSRVLYFSVFSMGCLLSLATWQVLYLRQYFKSKKLIE